MMTTADHGRRGRRGVAMAVMAIADLGGGRRRRRMAVAVMAVANLRRRDRGRMTVAMVTPAHLGRPGRRDCVVMAVMDAGLCGAADKGNRRGDQDNRQAVNGTDHAIS
jgi:hypothetical protein